MESKLKAMIKESKIEEAIKAVNSDHEFDVDGFHYVIVREHMYEAMLDLFRDFFYPDEPLSQSLGLLMNEELRGLLHKILEENISIALVSRLNGEVVGGRIIMVTNRKGAIDINKVKSETLKKYVYIVAELDRRCNFYDHYNVDEVMHFFGFVVRRDLRGRGIGEKLMRAAVSFVRKLGLGDVVIRGEGLSNFSKRVFEKVGFDTVAEVVYADVKLDGKVLTTGTSEHKTEKLFGVLVKS